MVFKGIKSVFKRENDFTDIVIVSGLPRSGTSLMMMMLEAGGLPPLSDQIRRADNDNPKGYYEFERAKKLPDGDTAWLEEARGKTVKVIAALVPYLPPEYHYKIIFMRRAMNEVLASQRKMLLNRGEDPNKIRDEDLARLFEQHIKQVTTWIQNQPHIQRIDVNYNQLMQSPAPQLAAVRAFLDLDLNLQKMISAIDRGLYRQRGNGSSSS